MTAQLTGMKPPPMSIYEALAAVMRDIEAIGKDRRNQQQSYNFRGIDDVYNMLNPVLAKHGVFTVPTVLDERTEERQSGAGKTLIYRVLKMQYEFFSADGSSVKAVVIGEGMDSGDKAANKAMSVAHKYAFLQVLAIPTEDDKDPENEHHEVAPRQHREPDGNAYNPTLPEHKKALAKDMADRKIPQDLWPKISAAMAGKFPRDLDDVIEDVYARERGDKR